MGRASSRPFVVLAVLATAGLASLWLWHRSAGDSSEASSSARSGTNAKDQASRTPRSNLPGGIRSEPLRSPTAAAPGAPRFRLVPPTESGLVFTNQLDKANTYTYLTNGAGLAVGDYDGDGLVDAYLVSQDGPNRLFRQVAPLRFEDTTTAAGNVDGGAAWGTGACFVDIDGDGDLDLYVCNLEAKNLLYVNQGDGTFREDAKAFGLDLVAASMMAAFADFDCDGQLDLYLLTNRALHAGWANTPEVLRGFRPGAANVRSVAAMVPTQAQLLAVQVLERDGKLRSSDDLPVEMREHFLVFRGKLYMAGQPDRLLRQERGVFVDVSERAGIRGFGMGLSATWCDYDRDGWPDLYVANDLESPDTLYHNQGDGTFRDVTAEVLPHTAYYGMGCDAGDLDGDGWPDFLVADMSMTTHQKAKVLMGDMDNQRAVLMHAEPPQYMRNALLLNTGRGRFQEAGFLAGLASTDWTWSVLFGDLDNDGRLDVFATNGIARFEMDPDFQLRVRALVEQGRHAAATELIQNVRALPERNLALRQIGDLQFAKTGAEWGLDLEAISHGAALVDFDGDGDLDVLVNNWNSPATLYENQSHGNHALVVALHGQASERHGLGARVTVRLDSGQELVRELTAARGYLSGQVCELHFGLGAALRGRELRVQWPSGHVQEFRDLAADQRYTVTEPPGPGTKSRAPEVLDGPCTATAAPPFHHREDDFDEYRDQPLLPAQVSRLGPGLALGDVDGDGRADLYIGGAAGQAGALFLATADGFVERPGPWQQDAASEDLGAVLFDADGDGDLDLFVASGGAQVPEGHPDLQNRLYRNDGKGQFVRDRDALPDQREASGHVAVFDADGDGRPDLVVAGRLVPGRFPDAPPTRLYGNAGGRFVDRTAELAPALLQAGMVTAVLPSDVDGDGQVDLLVAAHWQPLRFLRGEAGRFVDRTEAVGLAADTGLWQSLCAFDVDQDGVLDYVAGNLGRNTKYKADAQHPYRLFYGDFDDNGTRDLVEAKYEGDRLLPVRGRSCSSQAMPFLRNKFPTYAQFASSVLSDIYTEPKLSQGGQLAVTTLDSVWLRRGADGRFVVQPLPRRAQLAPLFGMAACGDWLLAAENSFAPEPETGRHDGGTGLLLAANPQGPVVVPPLRHGFVDGLDGKALVLRGVGAGVEALVAHNDGPLRAFRIAGARPVALPPELAKTPGPWRVRFHGERGERMAAEVAVGSGYLGTGSVLVAPTWATRAEVLVTGQPPVTLPLER
jgi:hypothetical protein